LKNDFYLHQFSEVLVFAAQNQDQYTQEFTMHTSPAIKAVTSADKHHAQARLSLMQSLSWTTLFETLLGQSIQFSVDMEGGDIVIRTNKLHQPKIIEIINDTLATPGHFQEHLPYKIQYGSSALPKAAVASEPIPALNIPSFDGTVSGARKFLLCLFGEDFFTNFGNVFEIFNDKEARVENGVLYSKATTRKNVFEAWKRMNDECVSYFNGVSIETIRKALGLPDQPLPEPASDLSEGGTLHRGIAAGLIQQCFGAIEFKDSAGTTVTEARVYFNVKRFLEYVLPPQCTAQVEVPETDEVKLYYSREHLVSYMLQLSRDGVLFRVFKDEADAKLFARPVFLGREETIAQPHFYHLLVDRSGSMDEYNEELNGYLNAFVTNLREIDPSAKVRIAFIDSQERVPAAEFLVTESKQITDFLKVRGGGGDTPLCATLHRELYYLLSNHITRDYNTVTVLFTDGRDDNRKGNIHLVPQALERFRASKTTLPKMFTLGFGKCDHQFLASLADTMMTPYIHLSHLNDFQQIYEYLSLMNAARRMYNLVYQIEGSANTFTVPVYQNSHPTAPNVCLPLLEGKPASVVLDGQTIIITVSDSQRVPLATLNDKLARYLQNATFITQITDPLTTPKKKINALREILSQVNSQGVPKGERMQVDLVNEIILADIAKLIAARKDEALHAAAISAAAFRGGFWRTDSGESTSNQTTGFTAGNNK
jgi:hypothetical protein